MAGMKKLRPSEIMLLLVSVLFVAAVLLIVSMKLKMDSYADGLVQGFELEGTYAFDNQQPSLSVRFNDENGAATWQYFDGEQVHEGKLLGTENPNRYVLEEASGKVYAQVEISRLPSAKNGIAYLTFAKELDKTYAFTRATNIPTTLSAHDFPGAEGLAWPRP